MNSDEKDKARYQVRTLENALEFLERKASRIQSEYGDAWQFVEAMQLLETQVLSEEISLATSRMVDRMNSLQSELELIEKDCKALEESTQKLRELAGLNDPPDLDDIPF